MVKLINNIVGLFVGEDSKKRQMSIIAGTVWILISYLGWIDPEVFKLGMLVVGAFGGLAVSARLTKISKALKK